jgi:predicted SAM-dependent methyltransferase
LKIHVGCGSAILPGWLNIDIEALPGVDLVHDVRDGLPFEDVGLIFAEHFIEHLDFEAGFAFMRECRRVLNNGGVLRLSTPNLDWVWRHQYHPGSWARDREAVRDCFWVNRAFRGWGHRFLYNSQTLAESLFDAGFATVEQVDYGSSRYPELREIEGHETYPDSPDLPHVIVVEASGSSSTADTGALSAPRAEFEAAVACGLR